MDRLTDNEKRRAFCLMPRPPTHTPSHISNARAPSPFPPPPSPQTLTDYLERVTLPALAEARDPHLLLRAVGEQWERFALLNSWLHKLLIFVVCAGDRKGRCISYASELITTPIAGAVVRGAAAVPPAAGPPGAGRPSLCRARLLQQRVRLGPASFGLQGAMRVSTTYLPH